MKKYVAGFMFSEDMEQVAFIRKKRPEWQAGLLNAIGGHIEKSDFNTLSAMIREFKEEAGCLHFLWDEYALIKEEGIFEVYFFCTIGDLNNLQTITDENITLVNVKDINKSKTIENLPWLIHLALDYLNDGRPKYTKVIY